MKEFFKKFTKKYYFIIRNLEDLEDFLIYSKLKNINIDDEFYNRILMFINTRYTIFYIINDDKKIEGCFYHSVDPDSRLMGGILLDFKSEIIKHKIKSLKKVKKKYCYLVESIEDLNYLINFKNLIITKYRIKHISEYFFIQNKKVIIFVTKDGECYERIYENQTIGSIIEYNSENHKLVDTKTEIRKYKLKLLENL